MTRSRLGGVVLIVLGASLTTAGPIPSDANGVVHVYNLPGTEACEKSAADVCSMVVRMCASDETECEIQCRADKPPPVSDECLRTHPCARDVESFCSDIIPGKVMQCLKEHQSSLAADCRAVSVGCAARGVWGHSCCAERPVLGEREARVPQEPARGSRRRPHEHDAKDAAFLHWDAAARVSRGGGFRAAAFLRVPVHHAGSPL
jgi:hypothetical protein